MVENDGANHIHSQIPGKEPSDARSAFKKLSALVRNRCLTVGDIFCLVIKRPRNRSLPISTSDSIEFKFEILKRNHLNVLLGT